MPHELAVAYREITLLWSVLQFIISISCMSSSQSSPRTWPSSKDSTLNRHRDLNPVHTAIDVTKSSSALWSPVPTSSVSSLVSSSVSSTTLAAWLWSRSRWKLVIFASFHLDHLLQPVSPQTKSCVNMRMRRVREVQLLLSEAVSASTCEIRVYLSF